MPHKLPIRLKTVKGHSWGKFLTKLNKAIENVRKVSEETLAECAFDIFAAADHGSSPLVPEDYNNLRQSAFIESKTTSYLPSPSFAHPNAAKLAKIQASHASVMASVKSQLAAARGACVAVGYSIYYAGVIHAGKTGWGAPVKHWTRDGSGPQFFSSHVRSMQGDIIQRIKNSVKDAWKGKEA